MSLRNEQYFALLRTRDFLRSLLNTKETKRIPLEVRKAAGRCLKHYPFLNDYGKPRFSQDPFGPDEPPERN